MPSTETLPNHGIITLKGIWQAFNEFYDEEAKEVIRVLPYSRSVKEYAHRLPIHCFMQIEIGEITTIKNVVEI